MARTAPAHLKLQPKTQSRILLVDDDRVMLGSLEAMVEHMGYGILSARDGKEALEMMKRPDTVPDVVLLDREMPGLKGLEVVQLMKQDPQLKRIPVVMQTALDRPDQVQEGIEAGVFYYLTKPIREPMLHSVLQGALRESTQRQTLYEDMQRQKGGLDLMDTGRFVYRTLTEAQNLACLLAAIYPDPERVLPGIAELLINAVEHGNLRIGYERKTELLASGTWHQEVDRLLALPQHQQLAAEAIFKRKPDGFYLQVNDEGEGFDWRRYLQVDPARASDNHGRGIAQANMLSFDRLRYNPKGNQVLSVVYLERENAADIAW